MPNKQTATDPSAYLADESFDVDARPEGSVVSSAVSSGWGDTSSTQQGDYPVDFKHSAEIQVIKFLDPSGPFAAYKMHFLKDKPGKKSYVCLGRACPLCALPSSVAGQKAEDKRAFTIVNLSVDPIQRQILTATPRLFKTLHQIDFSPQGPLVSKYWGISKTGERQQTAYQLQAIKARDLQEDWGIDAEAAEAAIASMEVFDRSVIRETSYADLVEIAAELS